MSYSSEVIEKIKQLRVNGHTLTEIIAQVGLSKSRTFDYIKDIPQSEFLKEKIRLARSDAREAIAAKRRGKSVKNYSFLKPKKWNPDLVNLVGHFLFDGELKRTTCAYNNRSQVLIQGVIKGMKSLLGVDDYKIYFNKITGVTRISYHNVEIATFIRGKADMLFGYIKTAPHEHKIAFLRSFFDDEGCVSFRGRGRSVRGYQHSIEILQLIQNLLSELNIASTIDKLHVEISITRKENLLKFQKLINFTPGLRVNGKRSNSVWKKDLEKREILKMAIDSYL